MSGDGDEDENEEEEDEEEEDADDKLFLFAVGGLSLVFSSLLGFSVFFLLLGIGRDCFSFSFSFVSEGFREDVYTLTRILGVDTATVEEDDDCERARADDNGKEEEETDEGLSF